MFDVLKRYSWGFEFQLQDEEFHTKRKRSGGLDQSNGLIKFCIA